MEKLNQRYGSTAIAKDYHSNGDKVTKMAFILFLDGKSASHQRLRCRGINSCNAGELTD